MESILMAVVIVHKKEAGMCGKMLRAMPETRVTGF
jgi:hypothetical protein